VNVRVETGQSVADALRGARDVVLAPGVHPGGVEIVRDTVLRGEPGAVLDNGGRGRVLLVQEDGITVEIEGIVVRGGHAELGAGLAVTADAVVRVRDCVFDGNHRVQLRAAGFGAGAGFTTFTRCRLGPRDDVHVGQSARVAFEDCDVAGDLAVVEGAQVEIVGGRVGRLRVRGTTTQLPSVRVVGAAVAEVDLDDAIPGVVVWG
jgi:hypothetical protein